MLNMQTVKLKEGAETVKLVMTLPGIKILFVGPATRIRYVVSQGVPFDADVRDAKVFLSMTRPVRGHVFRVYEAPVKAKEVASKMPPADEDVPPSDDPDDSPEPKAESGEDTPPADKGNDPEPASNSSAVEKLTASSAPRRTSSSRKKS